MSSSPSPARGSIKVIFCSAALIFRWNLLGIGSIELESLVCTGLIDVSMKNGKLIKGEEFDVKFGPPRWLRKPLTVESAMATVSVACSCVCFWTFRMVWRPRWQLVEVVNVHYAAIACRQTNRLGQIFPAMQQDFRSKWNDSFDEVWCIIDSGSTADHRGKGRPDICVELVQFPTVRYTHGHFEPTRPFDLHDPMAAEERLPQSTLPRFNLSWTLILVEPNTIRTCEARL